LVKVTDWANRETAYSYDANGRLIETLRPNGTKQTRAYDAKGQLLQQTDSDAAGNVITQFGFTYDASGDITEETTSPLPELVEGSLPTADMTYGPGNRLATYNPSTGSGQSGESVQFDADGNMTHGPLGGMLDNFVYDSRSRIVQAGTTQYLYNAKNQRIGVDGTRFVVNSQPALSQVLVKEENGDKTFYVYGLGLIGEESAASYKAYHFDFRGSTVALSDESGEVLERFSYSAYGVLLSGDATLTPFLFNGMYGVMTDGNGLYHMRARFYSAEIRRFLNRDVLVGSVAEGQSLNRFAFVSGKPVRFVDPFGLGCIPKI
jgi:RHS repeat-associated protein